MVLKLRHLMRVPPGLVRIVGGGTVERDGLRMDPQSQMLLQVSRELTPSQVTLRSAEEIRRAFKQFSETDPAPPVLTPQPITLKGATGPLPARLYKPAGLPRRAPALVYFHGGGFVIGDAAQVDYAASRMARDARCMVISVDYRLAPEHPFPAAPDDAEAAVRAIREDADALGIDPRRLAVGGDSAGGNLATVVCQRAKRSGDPQPCFQLLVYPWVDLLADTPSRDIFADGFLLTRPILDWFANHYAPEDARTEPDVSPARADDLSGLAPALTILAGHDPLRDEGHRYADALRAAGVPSKMAIYPSTFHGFFGVSPHLGVSERALARAIGGLDRGFRPV